MLQIYLFRGILFKEMYKNISTKRYLYKAIEAYENAVKIAGKLDRTYIDKKYDIKKIEELLENIYAKRKEMDLWLGQMKKEREILEKYFEERRN